MMHDPRTWIPADIAWRDLQGVIAFVINANSEDLVEFLAVETGYDFAIEKGRKAPKAVQRVTAALSESNHFLLRAALLRAALERRVPPNWWVGDKMGVLYCHGVFRCDNIESGLVVLVGAAEPGADDRLALAEIVRGAKDAMTRYKEACQQRDVEIEDKRRSVVAIADLHPNFKREELLKLGDLAPLYGPPVVHRPRMLDGVERLPLAIVCRLARGDEARHERSAVTACSKAAALPPRDGTYTASKVLSGNGYPGAVVTWAPRSDLPSYPEIRAAVERGWPQFMRRPRRADCEPPDIGGEDGSIAPASGGRNVDLENGVFQGELGARLRDLAPTLPIDESAERAEGRIRTAGFEAIGWFQSFHDYEDVAWGIYLNSDRLLDYAYSLYRPLKPHRISFGFAVGMAVELVYQHELFHAKVEAILSWLEVSRGRAVHRPYKERVYLALKGSEGLMEEALANWASWRWLLQSLAILEPYVPEPKRLGNVQIVVEESLDLSPPGYRQWRAGANPNAWIRFNQELLTGRPRKPNSRSAYTPLNLLPRLERVMDFRAIDVPVWIVGSGVVADLLLATPQSLGVPSRREAERVLRHCGYDVDPSAGRGSHEKWTGPDRRAFMLPRRDPLSVGVFKTLLGHLGMTKKEYIRLREAL